MGWLTAETIPLPVGLGTIYLCTAAFEFSMVAGMGIASRAALPQAPGLLESSFFVANGVGRILAALVATKLWDGTFRTPSFVCLGVYALMVLHCFVTREPKPSGTVTGPTAP